MKLVLLLTLVASAAARPEGHYDSKYDNFNVDDIITNSRLLKSYAHCFLGEGKCTPDGNNFKNWIPETLQTRCNKCTEKQKILIAKVIKALTELLPEEWERLRHKHDPEKKSTADLQAFVSQYAH